MITTGIGTPRSLPLPSQNRSGLLTGTVVPLAARKPAPRATPYMPSVPMNAGTRRREISVPLMAPGSRAASMAASRPARQRQGGVDRGQGLHGPRHDHAGEAHDEADREVDAAGDDDEGLAEAEEQRHRRRDGDALQVVAVEQERDAVGRPGPGLEEDQEQEQEQPRPGDGEEREGRVAPLRRGGGRGRRSGGQGAGAISRCRRTWRSPGRRCCPWS